MTPLVRVLVCRANGERSINSLPSLSLTTTRNVRDRKGCERDVEGGLHAAV